MTKKKKTMELLDNYGISLEAPTELNHKMKEGLARMYADDGIRAYLENAIKVSNRNLIKMMDAGKPDEGKYYANRIQTLISLLIKAQDSYKNPIIKQPSRSSGLETKEEIKL